MKEFKSITELELLYNAYYNILGYWGNETEKRKKIIAEGGTAKTSTSRIIKYNSQLNELRDEILKLEKQQKSHL